MLANDRELAGIGGDLVDLDDVFHHADYQSRYFDLRLKLMKKIETLRESLPPIQAQINSLREGQTLTSDKADAAQLHLIAEKLQQAYDKQKQLTTDLGGVVQAMMDYEPPQDLDVAQSELAEQSMPKDMRDIKSYLRFDGQRDVVDRAENAAADSAIELATRRCASP